MTELLRCAECGQIAAPDCRGWKAELGDDPEDDESPEVVLFCPACWTREFGEHH